MPGKLYIVATPIGNLGDITTRALETLRVCDFIAAEDTRVGLRLLSAYNLQKPLVSYYEHNMYERGAYIIGRIASGEDCALITDAGTPAISDPGGVLVRQCREAGIEIFIVPGPSALTAAVALAGMESTRFTFEGFLSTNRRSRAEHLASLIAERRPMVFYEAPHKLLRTLEDYAETFGGDRGLFIARELTKIHEESFHTTVAAALERYRETPPRGEFVLIVDGAAEPAERDGDALEQALAEARELIKNGESSRDAVRKAAELRGVPRNALYELIIAKNCHPERSEGS